MKSCTDWCLKNSSYLIFYAQGKLGSRENADVTVQNALLKIFLHEKSGKVIRDYKSFAFKILDEIILDKLKPKESDLAIYYLKKAK